MAISGYTVAEVQQEVSNGHIIPVEALDKYQRINPDRGVEDTIRYLITSDPQLSPLYFILVRLWAQGIGDSPAAVRSLSALLSLLLFPSIYWLCLELFKSPCVGWVALGIIAVSPLHLLYAQEARPYSLWSVTIVLSSAALLRAIRCQNLANWGLYALSLSLGLYTHLLTALVAIAHGIYVLVLERFRLNKASINYLLSALVGFFLFLPWLIILFTNINKAKNFVSWTSLKLVSNPFDLIAIFLTRASRIFFDINLASDFSFITKFALESPLWYGICTIICCLLLIIYISYFLIKKSAYEISLFIGLLGGFPVLSLMLPDLIFGGIRSIQFRYELPFYITLQLGVAYVLAFCIAFENRWQNRILQFIIVGFFLFGLVSNVMIFNSDTWWTKAYGVKEIQTTQLINQSDSPLLVGIGDRLSLAKTLCLSRYLEPKVHLLLGQFNPLPMTQEGVSNIFIIDDIFTLDVLDESNK